MRKRISLGLAAASMPAPIAAIGCAAGQTAGTGADEAGSAGSGLAAGVLQVVLPGDRHFGGNAVLLAISFPDGPA